MAVRRKELVFQVHCVVDFSRRQTGWDENPHRRSTTEANAQPLWLRLASSLRPLMRDPAKLTVSDKPNHRRSYPSQTAS